MAVCAHFAPRLQIDPGFGGGPVGDGCDLTSLVRVDCRRQRRAGCRLSANVGSAGRMIDVPRVIPRPYAPLRVRGSWRLRAPLALGRKLPRFQFKGPARPPQGVLPFVADRVLRARAAASSIQPAKAEARRGSRLSDGIVYRGQSPSEACGAGGMGSPAARRACCMAGNAPAPGGVWSWPC
jgi:hypothetical protein